MTYEDISTLNAIMDSSHDLGYRYSYCSSCLLICKCQYIMSKQSGKTLSIVSVGHRKFQRYVIRTLTGIAIGMLKL